MADLLANRNRLPSHIKAARTIDSTIAISKSCCIGAKRIDFKNLLLKLGLNKPKKRIILKTLNDLVDGQTVKIGSYKQTLGASRRLMELGLMPGVRVRFIKSAPLGDPIAVDVEGRQLSLRREDAAQIYVQPE